MSRLIKLGRISNGSFEVSSAVARAEDVDANAVLKSPLTESQTPHHLITATCSGRSAVRNADRRHFVRFETETDRHVSYTTGTPSQWRHEFEISMRTRNYLHARAQPLTLHAPQIANTQAQMSTTVRYLVDDKSGAKVPADGEDSFTYLDLAFAITK